MKFKFLPYAFLCLFLVVSCSSETEEMVAPPVQNEGGDGDGDGGGNEDPDPASLPEVRTLELGELSVAFALLRGNLDNEGDTPVTEVGFVIGTAPGATLETNFARFPAIQDRLPIFELSLGGLPASSDFFVRGYAINGDGVGYGDDIAFTTLEDKVFEGNVTLTTQDEVESFGANGYTTIMGELVITGAVNDLTPLSDLELVSSKVEIRFTELQDLQGLNNLADTGFQFSNGFRIESNSMLQSLQGLNRLQTAGGEFIIINNDLLTDLKGLDNFNRLIGVAEFRVQDCDNLTSLDGIENFEIAPFDLVISDNPLLSDISGLSNLRVLGFDLVVRNCNSLTSLSGLQGITSLNGIRIIGNTALTSLEGLDNVIQAPGTINLEFNTVLSDLSALSNITETEFLDIESNDSLLDFQGLEGLNLVKAIRVERNLVLQSFQGLNNLEEVNGLTVIGNDALINFSGLENLRRISNNTLGNFGSLTVIGNSSLLSMDGLENLIFLERSLQIVQNSNLSDFCALQGLFKSNGFNADINIFENLSNPSQQDIEDGNCD